VVLSVCVQPKSARNELIGPVEGYLKIKVTAPPVEGAANEACRKLLSDVFGIAKGRVQVISGSKSRGKRILLQGLDAAAVVKRLEDLLRLA